MYDFDIITSLPTSLSCGVLRDWLDFRSVVALDSAYCCKSKHLFIEELLRSEEFFVREKIVFRLQCGFHRRFIVKWGRNFRLVEFNNCFSEAQGRLIPLYCHHLTHVHFVGPDYVPSFIRNILIANSSIESLRMLVYRDSTNPTHGAATTSLNDTLVPNLASLAMTGYAFDQGSISNALKMNNRIVRLDLQHSNLRSPAIAEVLKILQCQHMISLGLAHTSFTDDNLSQLAELCPNILHLNIECSEDHVGITDAGILAVVQNLKGLQSLNIRNNRTLTDASLIYIYTHSANTLHTLYLSCYSNGGKFGARIIHELLERCTMLRTFYFDCWHDHFIYEKDTVLPAEALRQLTTLVLQGSVVSETNLTAVGSYGTNLRYLGVMDSQPFDHATTLPPLEGCPQLRELYTNLDTTDTLAFLTKRRPELLVGEFLPKHLWEFDVINM